jgi:hypothetical protein
MTAKIATHIITEAVRCLPAYGGATEHLGTKCIGSNAMTVCSMKASWF